VTVARIRDGISNARNEYGDCARNLNCDREIKTNKRERPEHFRHLTDSDSVNDRELGSNDSLGEDKEGKVWRLV
jgi:hypothetical protein